MRENNESSSGPEIPIPPLTITEAPARRKYKSRKKKKSKNRKPKNLLPSPVADGSLIPSPSEAGNFDAVAESVLAEGEPGAVAGEDGAGASQAEGVVLAPQFTEASVALWLDVPFNVAAGTWGDKWKLERCEKDALVPLVTAVANKRAPQWFKDSEYQEEIFLGLTLCAVIAPRCEAVGKFLEWATTKLGGSADGSTIQASRESSDA